MTVALIGPDGAGKSTISRLLEQAPLPAPVKTIYMGVNLEASRMMLPTTRLALAMKRRRGGAPDLTPVDTPASEGDMSRRTASALKSGARLTLWLGEEWFRQAVAFVHGRRGAIVVFDRHFFADYYHYDVVEDARRPLARRIHGFALRHLYPKPDLVVCLDAPGDVLYARKNEGSPEWLEARRHQYLEVAAQAQHSVVIDATRPLQDVHNDVVAAIDTFCRTGAA